MQQKYIVFFLLFSFICNSQNTISGKITGKNGLSLEGGHIHASTKSTLSNSDGFYKFDNLPNSNVKIYITYIGYKSIDTIVAVKSNMTLNFELKESKNQLDEVILNHRENSFSNGVINKKLTTKTIEKYSNQSLGNLLKEVTGVSVLKTGSSIVKPIINGLHSSRVPIFNNNVKIEDQQWGIEHAPNFDVNAAGKITVLKGAAGLQFGGDAVGGIIIIEPFTFTNDTLFGKSIATLESNGKGGTFSTSIHKGNFCDWSWNAQTSLKYYGDRFAPDYNLSNTGNREANFSGDVKYIGKKYEFQSNYSYYSANIGILRSSHLGSSADLYNAISNDYPLFVDDFTYDINHPKQQVNHHLAKVSYNRLLENDTNLNFQYSFQFNNRKEYDLRRTSSKPALDLDLMTHAFNIDLKKHSDVFEFKLGVSGSYQNNFADSSTGIRPLIPSYDKLDFGGYSILDYHVSEKLSVELGVRYDFSNVKATKYYLKSRWDERNYSPEFNQFIVSDFGNQWLTNPEFTFHNVSLSTGLQYSINNKLNFYTTINRTSRNPNVAEFFSDGLHHSTGMIELGDLRVNKEISNKISISIQQKSSVLNYTISPFINYIQDYIFLKPIGFETTIRGAFPVWAYNQSNVMLSGIDADMNWDISKNLKHFFSLAYVLGRNTSEKIDVIDIPPLNINNKIVFSKKQWKNATIELKSEMVFKQEQFPNYNFNTNIIVEGNQTPVEVDISSTPNAYHLLHFYSDVNLNFINKSKLTVALSVFNIFNTSYRDYLNKQRFFVDEQGRNIQLQIKINY